MNPQLLNQLGISVAKQVANAAEAKFFTTSWREVSNARWDSSFWNPESVLYEKAIEQGKFQTQPLGLLCEFSNQQWDVNEEFQDSVPDLEISAIDTTTGKFLAPAIIGSSEAPSRAKMLVRRGDILISTTRPGRGAVAMVGLEHMPKFVACTGFAVVREVSKSIDKDYLYCLLRSEISLQQMNRRTSGGNYPAITQIELEKIKIPVPPLHVQRQIVEAVNVIHTQASRLIDTANQKINIAKAQV